MVWNGVFAVSMIEAMMDFILSMIFELCFFLVY